jgi:hypothetical protein
VPRDVLHFAAELQRAYAPYVTLENGTARLEPTRLRFEAKDGDTSLQCAFDEFVRDPGPKRWLADEYDTFVRLRSGRVVGKYVSILELLNANDLLARLVGRKLADRIKAFQAKHPSVRLVTDSEGSYFLARHLLNDQDVSVEIEPSVAGTVLAGPTIAFADAVYRGETMKAFAARQLERIGALCAVDLRLREGRDATCATFEALLYFPFDPKEVGEDAIGPGSRVMELDQITLAPCEPADATRYALGTTAERTEFILGHPELFRYGIHLSGGRIHVVSHSIDRIVTDHPTELARWVGEEVAASMTDPPGRGGPAREVVLFVRSDSTIRDMVSRFAAQLESTTKPGYRSALPFP